ncbi:hypothetical protein [Dyadobacter frigoris]|uniref:Pyrroline-5-carboxylate reductase catalytic N-terminal domain-containing protein n=1 Tax=Dyadobacter frigoris TaxID=2576211 RepID=A0A4U6CW20_9BACT|nr:hypothetical protein [Dyadobacter frigoris]TKT87945.1 hypothetical protein FDK13_27965 [Dyadobacter frigoris]
MCYHRTIPDRQLCESNPGIRLANVKTSLLQMSLAKLPNADIILLALPWSQVLTLTKITDWTDRIVIDATN